MFCHASVLHRHEIDLVGVLTVRVKPHLATEATLIGKREPWWKSDQHRRLHEARRNRQCVIGQEGHLLAHLHRPKIDVVARDGQAVRGAAVMLAVQFRIAPDLGQSSQQKHRPLR